MVLLSIGAKMGYDHAEGQAAKSELEAITLAEAQANVLRKSVDSLSITLATEKAVQKPKDRIIYRETVRYETLPLDRRCILDGAWRVLHDSAASGDPAAASGAFDVEAAGVTDAAALSTVAENYETCRGWREDLIGWQRFWAAVSNQGENDGVVQ